MQKQFIEKFADWYGKGMAKSVTFVVTDNCNIRCSYCYQGNKSNARMSLEVGKAVVDFLFTQDSLNGRYINPTDAPGIVLDFIGGEPLLEIALIDRIIDYFRDKALALGHRWAIRHMICMSTNGTLYFQPEVQRFLAKNEGRVSMSVTVDGNRALHDACRVFPDGSGSYDLAAAAFRDIVKRYNQCGTKLTIAPGNVAHLAEAFVGMVEEFGLEYLHANCVYEKGWEPEHAAILEKQMDIISNWLITSGRYQTFKSSLFDSWIGKPLGWGANDNENWCGGTGKMLAFDHRGDIYPCLRYTESSLAGAQEPYKIGNVRDGFCSTPLETERCACLDKITRRSQSTDECYNCPIASGCAWCSAYNYQVNGTPDSRVIYICEMHKARCRANERYWARVQEAGG